MEKLNIKRVFKASKPELLTSSIGMNDFWVCEITDNSKKGGYSMQLFGEDKEGLEQIKTKVINALMNE